jgi:UDP-3-O-[3-hydroxymyristoyl] glucosamine N-acyltransferase
MSDVAAKTRHYMTRLRSVAHVGVLVSQGYRGSRRVHLDARVHVARPSGLSLGEGARICRDVTLDCLSADGGLRYGQLIVGDRVFIGERTTIVSHGRIVIGAATMVAHNCSIMDFNHGTALGTPMRDQAGRVAEVSIGQDCWLGAGVIVLPGVAIGTGTVVAAGSVVTSNLPENVIAAGIPAVVRRNR